MRLEISRVSPDERIVVDLIDRAAARARTIALARLAACSLVGAAIGAEIALLAKIDLVSSIAVTAAVALLLCVRRPLASRPAVLARLERAEPAYRNLLVTADELRTKTDVSSWIRSRVFADAAAVSMRVELTRIFPASGLLRVALIACATWAVVAATTVGQKAPRNVFHASDRHENRSDGRPSSTLRSPRQSRRRCTRVKRRQRPPSIELRAIEGSGLTLQIETASAGAAVTHDGSTRALERDKDGRFVDRDTIQRTGYLAVVAAGARRTIPVVVWPDALPTVRITTPGRDLVYAGGNPRDFRRPRHRRLRHPLVALRYTKVSGSGENYEFKEGEIPLDRAP